MKIAALSKTYNGRTVLQTAELSLQEGQITAVIGPNGSGKTTLGRLLSGIERPDQAACVLPDPKVGYMPQKSYAFRMSTLRNMMLNGKDSARAEELMTALHLEPLARQSARRLSGGETAKMALCRLLMGRYDLLILDEPTAAMDMESTLISEQLIRSYCDSNACAVLLITHSIQQARRIADHVIFLNQGRLIEQGETAQLLLHPEKQETRQFLEFYGL